MHGQRDIAGDHRKKALKPNEKRELVAYIKVTNSYSFRRACGLVLINRGTFVYQKQRKDDSEIIDIMTYIASTKLRWGFKKIYDWLRLQNYRWNHKKVRRIYILLRLNHRIKPKKRLPSRHPKILEVPSFVNKTWSMDFMSDSLDVGRKFRTLNVIDDHNREILAVEVDYSLPASRVIRVLNQISEERGLPQEIRVDNGPEFISEKLATWARLNRVRLEHIQPGNPSQNAYIERFNRTYREDVLDMYIFRTLDEVRNITTEWMYDYNYNRPHNALGGIPPRAFLSLS